MRFNHMMCETASKPREQKLGHLQRQKQHCRTTNGQVQLPGKILLQADHAAGKHCSLTGVCLCSQVSEKERVLV